MTIRVNGNLIVPLCSMQLGHIRGKSGAYKLGYFANVASASQIIKTNFTPYCIKNSYVADRDFHDGYYCFNKYTVNTYLRSKRGEAQSSIPAWFFIVYNICPDCGGKLVNFSSLIDEYKYCRYSCKKMYNIRENLPIDLAETEAKYVRINFLVSILESIFCILFILIVLCVIVSMM